MGMREFRRILMPSPWVFAMTPKEVRPRASAIRLVVMPDVAISFRRFISSAGHGWPLRGA